MPRVIFIISRIDVYKRQEVGAATLIIEVIRKEGDKQDAEIGRAHV